MKNWLSRTPPKCWAYLGLSIWAALSFMLLHKTPYGIDEGAARSLLLIWSVADAVVSPVVTLGLPDFRAIFLAPIGLLWTGSVLAAKVATILILSIAIWTIHAWRRRNGNEEGALMASGLLLLAPLTLNQIDTISVAAYLLIAFGLGIWSSQIYRESPKAFGGMYFSQLFFCMVSVSLHPVGIAYPLALLWTWYRNPLDKKQQTYFFSGIVGAVLMALALTNGWSHTDWFANPIKGLSTLFSGGANDNEIGAFRWVTGITMLLALLLVVWKQAKNLWEDLLGQVLLFAAVIGLLVGDEIFGVIALVTCLYWGLPLLLKQPTSPQSGFWQQRGAVLVLICVLSSAFMIFDKARYQTLLSSALSPRDSLIKTLAEDSGLFLTEESAQTDTPKKPLRLASQWPGLTMLACRCDALPLPPEAKDGEALFSMLKNIHYLIFDPRDPANRSLARNLATMGAGRVETIVLQEGGVIVQIKGSAPAQTHEQPK
jgi:hypothetical protein